MKHSFIAWLPFCLPLCPLPPCLLSPDDTRRSARVVIRARGATETMRCWTFTAEHQNMIPVLLEVNGWERWDSSFVWSSALSGGSVFIIII